MGRIIDFFRHIKYLFRYVVIFQKPKWFWYDIGQDNWYPTLKEQIPRAFLNVAIFLITIEFLFYIALKGLQTPFFQVVKDIAQILGYTEVTWMIYGLVLGIGASLLFGSIYNHKKSVISRIETSFVYVVYFGLFIFALNLFLWMYSLSL